MTTYLQISSYREVKNNPDGSEYFEIRTVCSTALAPFPDKNIFLFKIYNSRDPGADIFQRVCTISDIENYQNNRAAAILANEVYWRATEFTVSYDAINTANQSAQIISDRVNNLSNDYETYVNDFEASPEVSSYPTADATYIQGLKDTYTNEVTAFGTATTNATTASTARDDAETDVTASQSTLQDWVDQKDEICGNLGIGGGTEVGLAPSMLEAYTYFIDLLDTGVPSSALAILTAINTFITDFDKVKIVSTTTEKITLVAAGYVAAVPLDIGRAVTDNQGIPETGVLVSYDNTTRTWWVAEASGTFTGTMTIPFGTGTGDTDAPSVVDADGPLTPLRNLLSAAKTAFTTTYNLAAAHKANIATGNTDHIAKCTAAGVTVTNKTTAVTAAQTALGVAEIANTQAQAALQTAYDDVITAYDNVKDVCPDWSPVPPLPAAP